MICLDENSDVAYFTYFNEMAEYKGVYDMEQNQTGKGWGRNK